MMQLLGPAYVTLGTAVSAWQLHSTAAFMQWTALLHHTAVAVACRPVGARQGFALVSGEPLDS